MLLREILIFVLVLAMTATMLVGIGSYLIRPRHPEDLNRMIWGLFAMLAETVVLALVLATA